MFLPLKDDNPLKIVAFQYVTVAVIAVCVAVFLWQQALPPSEAEAFVMAYGAIPAVVFGTAELPPGLARIPSAATLVTSMFLHGGWWHLIGNMLYLWVFGDNVEDALGHRRFVVFYLLCGVAATLIHALVSPDSAAPVVGASGAISGVMGAYLVLHPRVKVLALVLGRMLMSLPAYLLLLGWLGLQILNVVLGGGGGVAWWAHLGGFAVGCVLVVPLRQPQVPLFDRDRRSGPWGRG